jgi:hypothetical protein
MKLNGKGPNIHETKEIKNTKGKEIMHRTNVDF